jgi:hypothetical protein
LLTHSPEFIEAFPKPLQRWEKIEIKERDSEEEAFGANGLMLDHHEG